jgi:hypothetical protein
LFAVMPNVAIPFPAEFSPDAAKIPANAVEAPR